MAAYKPDQRQQSSAGEFKQLVGKDVNPDGIYSGMTKRLKMVDGSYMPAKAPTSMKPRGSNKPHRNIQEVSPRSR